MEGMPGSPYGDDLEKVEDVSGQVCFEPTLCGVLWAFLEIVLVAVFGSLATQIAFLWVGFEGTQILESTRLLFLFMASETCITLLLIGFFLYLKGGNVTRLGWVWKGRQREFFLGVLFLPILFISTFAVGIFFELLLPQYVSSSNPLLELVQNFEDLGCCLLVFLKGKSIILRYMSEKFRLRRASATSSTTVPQTPRANLLATHSPFSG